jgi:GH35 family endo-1,4-beta-xylanase/Ca2+-binding RTX toxin-like protein
MSDLTVTVQDQNGNPLPDATLEVAMTQHAFRFGTQVRNRLFEITQPEFDALSDTGKSNLLQFGSSFLLDWEDVQNYRDAVFENFNHITPTNDMQWIAYRNAGPDSLDRAINQAAAQGLTSTGHAVVWGNDAWPTPTEFRPGQNPDAQEFHDALISERLTAGTILNRFSDTGAGPNIDDWDILNEPINERYYATTFVNGGIYSNSNEANADFFIRAEALRPDARLAINEYNILNSGGDGNAEAYRDLVNDLLDLGAPIDVIKVQAHIGLNVSKADIVRRFDILAETGLPIEISEFDMRDDANQLSPTQQEQIFRDFLEASFEHTSVEGFTMWGFWDPGHWRQNGPLFDADWNIKDEASPWFDLVQGDWKPDLMDLQLDSQGEWTAPDGLFDGTYNITASLGTESTDVSSFELTDDDQLVITLDVAELTVAIDATSVSEGDGAAATTGTVTRSSDTTNDLVVTLISNDSGEASVPTTVTIFAGETTSVPFAIDAIDDAIADGTQTVTVTATAADHVNGTDTLDITDDETAALTIDVAGSSISETGTTTGTISRNTDTDSALIVTLTSSDPGEATVPATVTIPTGSASATFTISGVNDNAIDTTQAVAITASGTGHTSDSANIDIKDSLAHRMSQFTVRVEDQFGNPLPDATIDVTMAEHAFKFGTQVRDRMFAITQTEFDALSETEKTNLLPNLESQFGIPRYTPVWQDIVNYRDAVLANFNHVVPTTGLQWIALNNNGPAVPDAAFGLANDSGLTTTGASVVWQRDRWPTPDEFRPEADPDPQLFHDALIADRLSADGVLARFSDTGDGPGIFDWKVLNEPIHEHYHADTFVAAGIYPTDIAAMVDYFVLADTLRPDATLSINEFNILNSANDDAAIEYRDLVNDLLSAGAPIDRIGIQAHISRTDITKADITRRLDILAETGLPIEISEFDARDDADQLTPAQQEQLFHDMLTASLEHPAVDGFIMWGAWDTAHWRGNAPLFDHEWNAKDEAAPWFDLVRGDWMTNLTDIALNSQAEWALPVGVFDGTYEVTASLGGQTSSLHSYELTEDGELVVTLQVDDSMVLDDGVLTITCTDQHDSVTARRAGDQFKVEAVLDGTASDQFFDFDAVESVVVNCLGGDDNIRMVSSVTQPTTLLGGDGNDTLSGAKGDDSIDGGLGADSLIGGSGNDQLVGGAGDDTLRGGDGDDTIIAMQGDNQVNADKGDDTVTTGDGDDFIRGQGGDDVINAGEGTNDVRSAGGNDTVTTGAGNDFISSGSQNDVVDSGDGNDEVRGGNNGDLITTGNGDDTIVAGRGADTVFGQNGNDELRGNTGDDILIGGDGDDLLGGNADTDISIGGAGTDTLNAGGFDDILIGGTTAFDTDIAAVMLDAIQSEWISGRSYANKVANLRDGSGTANRTNGDNFLLANTTVLDDGEQDELNGGSLRDWYFAKLGTDVSADLILGLEDDELVDELF